MQYYGIENIKCTDNTRNMENTKRTENKNVVDTAPGDGPLLYRRCPGVK